MPDLTSAPAWQKVGQGLRVVFGQTNKFMTLPLQLDSYQYKCRSCLKHHVGPTRVLDFTCVADRTGDHGVDRIWAADYLSVCDCDEPIKITFQIREHPADILSFSSAHSADADLIIVPKIRTYAAIVD